MQALMQDWSLTLDKIFDHEIGTVYMVKGKGLVVLTSCSHRGVINTVKAAQKASGIDKVHAVIGGFHIVPPLGDDYIRSTIAAFQEIDPDHLIPWISTDWKSHFKWQGVGPFPAEEQDRLREFVSRCERRGRKLRFWGAPDKPMVWRTLWESKVSLLGTDDLEGLARFQREQMQSNP